MGISREDFQELVEKAAAASSMQANPILLTRGELRDILEKSF
jgi:alcohol dehydrogenase class IV